MTNISQNAIYHSHDLNTKYYAVLLYRKGNSISFVYRRYKISKASLMLQNKLFDGTKDSLINKSHRPKSPHPNAHTPLELKWIKDYIRRNPNISMLELYGKLRVDKGYSRHACFLFRVLRKLGFYKQRQRKYKKYQPKHFYFFLNVLGTNHQLIRPRTPRHNGKVEGSHRNDNERFYKYL